MAGKTSIKLTKEIGNLPISQWMLYFPFRDYVIHKIKDPLRKAIETAKSFKEIVSQLIESASKLPKYAKGNIYHKNTLIIKDKLDRIVLYHHNPGRELMIKQATNLGVAEYEHDDYYAWLFDYLVVELAIEILTGNYVPKNLKFPIPHCWEGPEIPDRDKILKIVKSKLEEECLI